MTDRQRWSASIDEEALQSDAYLESLLAAHARLSGARATQTVRARRLARDIGLAPDLRFAAGVLERALPRFHPSFRFEEALAERLRAAAGLARHGAASASILAFPHPAAADRSTREDRALAGPLGFHPGEQSNDPRTRILLGGAIASTVSLAGAAFLVWRRTRRPD